MLDFTSALYLGLRHPSSGRSAPGTALTLGRPAALGEPPGAAASRRSSRGLQGCEQTRSCCRQRCICSATCSACSPASGWSSCAMPRCIRSRAGGWNRPPQSVCRPTVFPTTMRQRSRAWCAVRRGRSGDRSSSPMVTARAAATWRRFRAMRNSRSAAAATWCSTIRRRWACSAMRRIVPNPYGNGGGGALRWHGVSGPHIIVGSSLAKGFGAPLAVLAGSGELIDRFRAPQRERGSIAAHPRWQ